MNGVFTATGSVESVFVKLRSTPWAAGTMTALTVWLLLAMIESGVVLVTAAVVFLLGGVAQINPVWTFGPYRPGDVSSASQPDWYMGWLDGILRIAPAWELRAFGFEIPNPFFFAVLLPGLIFGALFLAPFIEERFTKDRAEHHLLDRPRDHPRRTAIAVASLAFYLVLLGAASGDVISMRFGLSVNTVKFHLQNLFLKLGARTRTEAAAWYLKQVRQK